MSPPTIPPFIPPEGAIQTANIIVEALRQAGYDAGIESNNLWKDFDIRLYRGNIVVGSRKRNRTWLNVYYYGKTITFRVVGNQLSNNDDFNLADPDSLKKISNYIIDVVNNDWYQYPWI